MSEVAAFRKLLPCLAVEDVESLEAEMMKLPQVACDVIHRFGPGLYIREVFIPAGSFAIGHHQKYEHMNVFLKGRVLILKDDGTTEELAAPLSFVGKPGRKIGYILEDMYWQNIYATEERDIETLEQLFFDKDESFQAHCAQKLAINTLIHAADRADFEAMLVEVGVSAKQAEEQSKNTDDCIDLPMGSYRFMVGPSPIEGVGVFATTPIDEGAIIGPARIDGLRTDLGRRTNHSRNPNAMMVHNPLGDIYLVASRSINGYEGGEPSEEITIDYRQAIAECREASRVLECQPSQLP